MKTLTKRCTKFLSKESWSNTLANKNWERIGLTEDVDEMAEIYYYYYYYYYICNGWNGQLPQTRLILLSPFEIG